MTQRFFYGWAVLAAAFVIITMSIGTLFTLGVFLRPIEDSMGWSRSGIGAIGLFNWVVMGVGGVVSGFVSDRLGTRRVVLVGAALLGLGLVLSSHVQEVWQLYVTFGLLVGAGVSAFYVPLTVLAIKWFDGRRAMAAAVVSTGNGLGILALAPLTRWLINEFDWRVAFLVLGNLAWVVVLPSAWLLREPAGETSIRGGESTGTRPSADRESAEARLSADWGSAGAISGPPHMKEPWRTWPFWAIALTHFCCCAAHSGPLFHLVSHAMDQGVAKMAAASILGASGLTSILGRIGAGIVADRAGAKPTLLAALTLQAALVLLYLFATSTGGLYAVSLAFGVAYGGAMPLYAVVTREYFGERVLGTAYGGVFFISCIGMGLGSYAGGAIHDVLGTYQWLFLGSFAIGAMAIILGVALRPPAGIPAARPSPALGG
ncbi:MAG TPA: MFS transporter [Candidatus Deferrimicrobiaceae bacterium]|nr:MFS transporter [Candidatus Deferrimicrobiaceae bacterium]